MKLELSALPKPAIKVFDGRGKLGASWDGTGPDGRDWDEGAQYLNEEEFYASNWLGRGSHGAEVANIIGSYSHSVESSPGVVHNSSKSADSGKPYNSVNILPIRVGQDDMTKALGVIWASGSVLEGVLNNPTPAKVINMSLRSSQTCPYYMQRAIDIASGLGSIVVVGSGNDASRSTSINKGSPSSCNNVISVSSHTPGPDPRFSVFSSVDRNVTISAPGGGNSCADGKPRKYGIAVRGPAKGVRRSQWQHNFEVGTSYSAPIVSGIVAMMLQVNPKLTRPEIVDILRDTGRDFSEKAINQTILANPENSLVNEYLYGRIKMVDAEGALKRVALTRGINRR